jgi:murein L,D-transpeptidase YafK
MSALLLMQAALAQGFSSVSSGAPAVANATVSESSLPGSPASFEQADKVVVRKGERRLYLLRQERVIAEYPVRLGLNPYGPKKMEGDFRTPEGRYRLIRRNPRSDFFLSIQVSYPSAEDSAVAKEAGFEPGGAIMIHGQPNVLRKSPEFYASRDWTDGCIALSNSDMIDVWLRTDLGIPIEILP